MTDTSLPQDLSDTPYGRIPSADQSILLDPPIETAIVEVRFAAPIGQVTSRDASALRDALQAVTESEFTVIETASEGTMQIDIGPDGPTVVNQGEVAGWRVATADRGMTAAFFPHSVIWQVNNRYDRWSITMGAPLAAILGVVSQVLKPELVQRVGLRYVNRLQNPEATSPSAWLDRIDGTLVGSARNRIFGERVIGAQQQIELALDGAHGGLVRHGLFANPSAPVLDYLLDLDVFAHAAEPFEATAISLTAQRLNRTAASLFQACLDQGYLDSLERREAAE